MPISIRSLLVKLGNTKIWLICGNGPSSYLNLSISFLCLIFFFIFLYNFTMLPMLISNSQSLCLTLMNAGITGVCPKCLDLALCFLRTFLLMTSNTFMPSKLASSSVNNSSLILLHIEHLLSDWVHHMHLTYILQPIQFFKLPYKRHEIIFIHGILSVEFFVSSFYMNFFQCRDYCPRVCWLKRNWKSCLALYKEKCLFWETNA